MHASKTLTESENNSRFLVWASRPNAIDIEPSTFDGITIRPSTRSTPAVVVPAFEGSGEVSKIAWDTFSFDNHQISITGISLPTYSREIQTVLPEQEELIFGGRDLRRSLRTAPRSLTDWMP